MRLLTAGAGAVLLVVWLAGVADARDPRAERLRLNAADVALAKRTTVRRTDLGDGWKGIPTTAGESGPPGCKGFRPNYSAFTLTGRALSGFARSDGSNVQSEVDVYESRKDAAGAFTTGARAGLARCLRLQVEKAVAPLNTLGVWKVSARIVAAPRLGERSAAYRVVATLSTAGRTVAMYSDWLLLQKGRSISALAFTAVNRHVGGQAALARTIAARMR